MLGFAAWRAPARTLQVWPPEQSEHRLPGKLSGMKAATPAAGQAAMRLAAPD